MAGFNQTGELPRRDLLGLAAGIAAGGFASVTAAPEARAAARSSGRAKLIEFGWDIPGPEFIRDNIARMQDYPFDGLIFNLGKENPQLDSDQTPDNGKFSIPLAFDTRRWREGKELKPAPLRGLDWGNLSDAFPLLWATNSAEMDWFNDRHWQTIEANITLFARLAREVDATGIAFDPEDYGADTWDYRKQAGHKQYAFDRFWNQVRERGAQFMRALHAGFPGTTLLTLGLLSWNQAAVAGKRTTRAAAMRFLERDSDGLWPAFVNGLLTAAPNSVAIVEGNERSYYLKWAKSFDTVAEQTRGRHYWPMLEQDAQDDYRAQVRVGNGIYVDGCMNFWKDPRFFGFCLKNDEQRLQLLEHNTFHSLRTADPGSYAWVYSERMSWWNGDVRDDVRDAVARAARKHRDGEALGFSINQFVKDGDARCS